MKTLSRISLYLLLIVFGLQSSCEKESAVSSSATTGAGGSLARFAVVDNYLYIVDAHSITIFDVTNPAQPVQKSTIAAGFDIETIFPYKGKLFLGASNGMYIFSIADPLKPVKEGLVTHFRACDPVVSNDSVSYVTLRSTGSTCGSVKDVLNVYNIKNIQSPAFVKEISMKSPYGLGIAQKALYVCEGTNGLVIFDLTDPYNPTRKAEIKTETYYDVIPYGTVLIAYIDKGIEFFDIADPLNPISLSKLKN